MGNMTTHVNLNSQIEWEANMQDLRKASDLQTKVSLRKIYKQVETLVYVLHQTKLVRRINDQHKNYLKHFLKSSTVKHDFECRK